MEAAQATVNNSTEKYLEAQQANQITLKQIKNETQQPQRANKPQDAVNNDDDEFVGSVESETNEKELLLGGQDQQPQHKHQQQQQDIYATKNATLPARVNFDNSTATTDFATDNGVWQIATVKEGASFRIKTSLDSQDGVPNAYITTQQSTLDFRNSDEETMQQIENNASESISGNRGFDLDIIQTPKSFTATTGTYNNNSKNSNDYKGPKLWIYLVRNYSISSQPLALLIVFLALWAIGYILLPEYAVPNTVIMRIALLFVGAQAAGILVSFINLPDMLGMLFFGVFYTNMGWADFSGYGKFEACLREMALINIMLLAGLGLDANAFKKLWFMILRLTLIPTIAEVAIISLLARYLLNMPWLWGILLGLVITAVSPNVVVTVMLKLKEDRLGLNNGIHTLIYAMTTCNDVVAIFVFGVMCGVIFTNGSLTDQILQGPIGIGIGIVFGYVYGLMLQFVPSRKSTYVNGLRFVLTVLGGTISVMGSKAIGYPSAGALGCVTVAFIAGIGWKRQQLKMTSQQIQENDNCSVPKRLDLLWKFLKPVSFALIGKEINFAVLDGKVVGYGALLVLLGSLFRLATAYLSTYGGNLSRKERAYITISGFPKATVQAALGPIALDLARSLNSSSDDLSLASNVLVISVIVILLTAPLGAILMLRLAPLWLQHSQLSQSEVDPDVEDSPADLNNYFNTAALENGAVNSSPTAKDDS